MRWDEFRRSSNVEDDRGASMGGGFGMPGGAHGLGIGTIIILGLVGWALGIDPSEWLSERCRHRHGQGHRARRRAALSTGTGPSAVRSRARRKTGKRERDHRQVGCRRYRAPTRWTAGYRLLSSDGRRRSRSTSCAAVSP